MPKIDRNRWVHIFQDKFYWKKLIEKAFSKAGIEVNKVENTYPGTHAVFRVNEKYIIKIFWDEFEDDYYVEDEILNYQKRVKKYFSGIIDDFKILIIDYIDGIPVRELYNKGYELNERIIFDLASFVKEYHSIDFSKLTTVSVKKWKKYFDLKRKYLLEKGFNYPIFSDKLKRQLKSRFENLSCEKYHNFKLVHADLTDDHILIEDDRFKGVIDFADSKVAPVEYEWVVLYLSGLNMNIDYFKKFLVFYGTEFKIEVLESIVDFIFLHQFGDDIIKILFKEEFICDLDEMKKKFLTGGKEQDEA
ncbi:MAG: phosphotransferase [Thermosipho sp. (in: Bacteria)]|nr:phosphotransferase [Thermosipho sp. (in: thermotogales)]